MIIQLTKTDLADAVNHHLLNVYGLKVDVNPEQLKPVELEVFPVGQVAIPNTPKVDVEREAAIKQADELGISYHPNIGTDNLIKRIEERELELVKMAKEETEDDDKYHPNYLSSRELEDDYAHDDDEVEEVTIPVETDIEELFPVEEVPNTEEKEVPRKKSIFDRSN